MPDFPAAVPDLPDATVAETLFTMHTNIGHVPATNRILLNLRALAGKLGIGASTPSGAGVLRQSGVAGSSAWGLVQPGDISPGTGNANRSLLVNPAGSAVAYAAVPSGGLVGAGAGSPNTVARTTDGTNVVYGKVTSSDILDGTIAPADIAAGGVADMLLGTVNGTQAVMTKVTTAMVPALALNASSLFGGGTGNRVLRTNDGTNAIWGQVGTPDIAAGAATTTPAVVGVPGSSTTSTLLNNMTGASISLTTQGGPVLILLNLLNMYNSVLVNGCSVAVFEGATNVGTLMVGDLLNTYAQSRMGFLLLVPAAGAHTYQVAWSTGSASGAATHAGGTLWAIEFKR